MPTSQAMSDNPTNSTTESNQARDLFDLTDRVAVVTGGSRGLGREMVMAFAERGADVVIASRKLDNCEQLATEVTRATGRRAIPVAYHAGNWDDSERLADLAYREFGKVDILVNNAGMSPLYKSVDSITEELYDKVLDVNLKGPFRLSALIGTRMVESGNGGSIIFLSSIASRRPGPQELVYGAAKAGLNNLTYGLSRTFRSNRASELHRARPVSHRYLQGLGPRSVPGPSRGCLCSRAGWRTRRGRRRCAVLRERCIDVHHGRFDRHRRWPALAVQGVRGPRRRGLGGRRRSRRRGFPPKWRRFRCSFRDTLRVRNRAARRSRQ